MKVAIDNSGPARQEIANCFACYPEFSRLVEDSVVKDKKRSIYSFVESVNDYLPKITRSMFAMVFFTPLSHDDQRHLHSITDGETLTILLYFNLLNFAAIINPLWKMR